MSEDQHEQYLAVLKALFDYEATSDDEVSIKEDQTLLLLERTDDEWWKVQYKANTGDDENAPSGLVPANYVEEAEPKSTVKVLFDYEAASKGELSIIEDEILKVFDYEEQWILVKTDRDGGRVGFVPESYVEEFNGESNTSKPNISHIIVPDSPPPLPSAPYMDPADRVAATTDKAKADAIETWSVSEVDSKGKKKKGTLGIGNGAIFFASESDKTPVQKWQTSDVEDIKIEKSKHVHFQITGLQPTNLHFHAGSKDVADAIVQKLKASKGLVNGISSPRSEQNSPRPMSPVPKKNGISVRFDPSPAVIPSRPETPVEEPGDYDSPEGESAIALYDFAADGEDELTVQEGEQLVIVDRVSSDEWWKCRNVNGAEGVVPALYIEINADDAGSISAEDRSDQTAAGEALAAQAEHERQEHEQQEQQRERERQERERQEREQRQHKQREREQRERKRKQQEREQQEREQQEREQQEREQQEREQQEREQQEREQQEREERERKVQDVRKEPRVSRSAPVNKLTSSAAGNKTEAIGRNSGETQPKFPNEGKTRIWHDHSGQWKTEAEFLGISKGKIRLHKTNGVIIEVPPEKMSVADVRYIESITNKKLLSGTSLGSRSHSKDDDDTPLGARKSELESGSRPALPPKKPPTIDWFEFFLNAGCEVDDCTRYASAFERDKIDEGILPDIKESTLRSLGLREGDIIRVTKVIEQRKGKSTQVTEDERLARALQAEEDTRRNSTSPPNLFTGPGGTLRSQRRTRPQRTPTAPPVNVDANALIAVSEQISRSTSPLVSSPSAARASSPAVTQLKGIPQPSGFEDDAWTNRPSSVKPTSVPPVVTSPPAPAVPPAPVQRSVSTSVSSPVATSSPAPAVTSVPANAPPAPPPPSVSAPPTTITTQPPTVLSPDAQPQQNNGQFELLARISQMRPPSAPVQPIGSPLQSSAPQSFHSGLGMGSSQLPLGQHLQNQQTGLYQMPPPNGPRGPLAPVPSNQGLLSPLVPATGFNQFIPTRPSSNPPLQLPSIQPSAQPVFQPSFLSSPPVPGHFNQILPQQTGFPGAFQSIGPQPTGFGNAYSGVANPSFMPPSHFGGIQPQPTGFNPGFPQQTFGQTSLTTLRPSSPQKDHSPAAVFAKMKAGTFADDSDAQPADKYDALRQQPTGWQGSFYPQGYGGF